MKTAYRVLYITLFFVISQVAWADNVLVYGNGMSNTPEEAVLSLSELSRVLSASSQMFGAAYVAYNHDETWWRQVWEIIKQKHGDFSRADPEIKNLYVSTLIKKSGDEDIDDEDLREHLVFYRKLYAQGDRPIVVSHSQGCFYANRAYEILRAEISNASSWFWNVQVASPSDHVATGGPWITFSRDVIINAVRETTSALPANVQGPSWRWKDIWNHSFVETYLDQKKSRQAIIRAVQNLL